MLAVTIISAAAAAVLLLLFILHSKEIKNVKKQTHELISKESNELVHSLYGGALDAELINEINDLLTEMRVSKETYAQKSHNLEQMLTNIAHDLRTPLTSAMGYLDLVMNAELPDDEKEKAIEIIRRRMNRLESLINSFFEFSKIISGDKRPELNDINVVGVLQEAVVNYYDDFSARQRNVIFNCERSSIHINSNRNMLMRIFDNLIGNAYKHGTGDLSVTVTKNDHLEICFENKVYDADMDVSRVFDEFYTTDISRTKGNTGLGLAIAKQFTEMLGGSISASYEKNIFSVKVIFDDKK